MMKRERNYGIDLLRLVSMLYVVLLHTLGQGGVLEGAANGSASYRTAWFLEIWAYCAVDIFALISGYVGYTEEPKRFRYSSCLLLWLQVVFYNAAVTAFMLYYRPEAVPKGQLLKCFFPVFTGQYWYLTAYAALALCIPLLNHMLRGVDRKTTVLLFWVFFLVFSVTETYAKLFEFKKGYSAAWVILLYVMGGMLKKAGMLEKIRIYLAVPGIIVLAGAALLWKLSGKGFMILDVKAGADWLVCYTSPTVLGAAILHLALFEKLRLREGQRKLIRFLAPGAFAVYILNCQYFVWRLVMKERFAALSEASPLRIAVVSVGFSLLFVFASVMLDAGRRGLFRLLRIPWLAEKAEEQCRKRFEKTAA